MRPLAVLALPLLVATSSLAQARDLRVGVDAPTIQAAIDAAGSGDRVVVPAGRYRENLDLRGKAVALVGEDGAAATLVDGGGADAPTVTIASAEGRATLIEGLSIRGSSQAGVVVSNASPTIRGCIVAWNAGAGLLLTNSGARIEGCAVVGNSGGLRVLDPAGTEIVGNEIRGNVKPAPDDGGGGVFIYSSAGGGAVLVERNLIQGNGTQWYGGGLFVFGPATVVGNEIVGNAAAMGGGGIAWQPGYGQRNQTFAANTVADNSAPDGTALDLDFTWAWNAEVRIEGNVFAGGPGAAAVHCRWTTPSLSLSVLRNDLWAGGATAWTGAIADPAGTQGNVSLDPRFVAPAARDYRLAAASPCIDAGDPAAPGLPATDRLGAPRSLDGDGDGAAAPDLGAYEFTGAVRVAVVRVEQSGTDATEGGDSTWTLRRDGGDLPAATIRVRTVALGASSGADFTPVERVVAFAPGATTASVVVPIADDGLYDPDEFVAVALDRPDAGCTVGLDCAAALRITDAPVRVSEYFVGPPGTRWHYRQATGETTRAEVLPGRPLVNGVPTTVVLNTADRSRMYLTLDDQGLRLHRIAVNGLLLPPYGRRNVSVTFDPPVEMAKARVPMNDPQSLTWSSSTGTADFRLGGLGRRKFPYTARFFARRGESMSAASISGAFDPLVIEGSLETVGDALEYGLVLGPGLGVVKSYLPSTGESASLTDTDLGRHAVSIAAVRVPRAVRLRGAATKARVEVVVRNEGDRNEVIEDAAMLDAFCSLVATPLGDAVPPTVARAGRVKFPIVVGPGRTVRLRYDATIVEADDPARGVGHEDFRVAATVTPAALDRFARSPLLPPVAAPVRAEALLDAFVK